MNRLIRSLEITSIVLGALSGIGAALNHDSFGLCEVLLIFVEVSVIESTPTNEGNNHVQY